MSPRSILAAFLSGPAAGLLMYGGLQGLNPSVARDEPWLLHFRAAGFETHLYRVTRNVKERFAIPEWLVRLKEDRYDGSRLLTLDVGQAPIHILELPTEALAKELMTAKRVQHQHTIAQEGRCICLVRPLNADRADPEETKRVIASFRERAKAAP